MKAYKKILVAVDLTTDSPQILDKAHQLAKESEAELSLVHVMEPLAVTYGMDLACIDIQGLHEELKKSAKQNLTSIALELDIPAHRQHLIFGHPAGEIRGLAKEIQADVIVIGSHGKHGWQLILGSTANGVLHGAPCDVLTVRI